jgi:hypothetical protein
MRYRFDLDLTDLEEVIMDGSEAGDYRVDLSLKIECGARDVSFDFDSGHGLETERIYEPDFENIEILEDSNFTVKVDRDGDYADLGNWFTYTDEEIMDYAKREIEWQLKNNSSFVLNMRQIRD